MRRSAVAACCLTAILLLGPTFMAWPGPSTPSSSSGPKVTARMLAMQKAKNLFECARKENPLLKWDDCLARKAEQRARKMVRQDYFDHKDPKTERNPAWHMVKACYRCTYAGENLSKGKDTAEAIHQAWMESTEHRENIENPRYRLLGVGCFDAVCVQLFAGF